MAATTRVRWAAIGAAVAVSVGAGGIGVLHATAPAGASAYVPISPCRLADTRPGPGQTGPHAGPLPADGVLTYAGWGDVPGVCDLPTGSTGLQLNVTAVDATTLTNLRFYPAGQPAPTASNLNPSPGEPPTPNAVTVALNPAGEFAVYNRFGSVHMVIDVLGYYTDHSHDDRYYTKDDADLATKQAIDDALTVLPSASGTVFLGPESFRSLRPAVEYVVQAGTEAEGAYVTSWDTPTKLVAPLQLPAGTVVNAITYYFYDNSAADLGFWLERSGAGFEAQSSIGGTQAFTSANADSYRSVTVNPNWTLAEDYSWRIAAGTADAWDVAEDNLRVQGVEISYTLP